VALPVMFLLLVNPARLFAKGVTVKITIQGADLKTPIEITDQNVLANIQVWSGLPANQAAREEALRVAGSSACPRCRGYNPLTMTVSFRSSNQAAAACFLA
jgi:hypothetical protein